MTAPGSNVYNYDPYRFLFNQRNPTSFFNDLSDLKIDNNGSKIELSFKGDHASARLALLYVCKVFLSYKNQRIKNKPLSDLEIEKMILMRSVSPKSWSISIDNSSFLDTEAVMSDLYGIKNPQIMSSELKMANDLFVPDISKSSNVVDSGNNHVLAFMRCLGSVSWSGDYNKDQNPLDEMKNFELKLDDVNQNTIKSDYYFLSSLSGKIISGLKKVPRMTKVIDMDGGVEYENRVSSFNKFGSGKKGKKGVPMIVVPVDEVMRMSDPNYKNIGNLLINQINCLDQSGFDISEIELYFNYKHPSKSRPLKEMLFAVDEINKTGITNIKIQKESLEERVSGLVSKGLTGNIGCICDFIAINKKTLNNAADLAKKIKTKIDFAIPVRYEAVAKKLERIASGLKVDSGFLNKIFNKRKKYFFKKSGNENSFVQKLSQHRDRREKINEDYALSQHRDRREKINEDRNLLLNARRGYDFVR